MHNTHWCPLQTVLYFTWHQMDKWFASYLVTFLGIQYLLRYYLHDCCSWSYYLWHNVHFHTWLTSTFPFPGQDNMRRGTHFHTHHRISRIYMFSCSHKFANWDRIFRHLFRWCIIWFFEGCKNVFKWNLFNTIYIISSICKITLPLTSTHARAWLAFIFLPRAHVHIVAENDGILFCFMNIVTLNFLYGLFRIKG